MHISDIGTNNSHHHDRWFEFSVLVKSFALCAGLGAGLGVMDAGVAVACLGLLGTGVIAALGLLDTGIAAALCACLCAAGIVLAGVFWDRCR